MKTILFKLLAMTVLFLGITNVYSQTADEYTQRGVDFSDKKMYKEALEMFRKAAALQDGNSAKAFHNRGWLMELQGNIPAAIENYKEAVRRNPFLSDSYERMGYWFYKAGKYADAVAMGEKVMKLDPANAEVKKWLPDAYRMKMEHPQAVAEAGILDQKPSPTAETAGERKKSAEDLLGKEKKPEEKEKPQPVLGLSLDTVLRFGYRYRSGSVGYYSTSGALMNIPFMFDSWFRPIPKSDTRFSFTAGNPYFGAGIPQTVSQMEKMEGVFSFGSFGIGGGIQLSHYYNDITFGKKKALSDFKLGGIVEFKDKESALSVSLYPKGIPYTYTTNSSVGKTMDVCTAQMKYTYFLDEDISYYSRLEAKDFYYYDNTAGYSDYWGFYDIAVGLTLYSKGAVMGKDLSSTVEIGKRVYLQDLGNTKPYDMFNGQGYLGMSKSRKKGSYFPGYHGTSNLLSFSAEEAVSEHLVIRQKLICEFVDKNVNHYEYAVQLGIGGKF